MRRRDSLSALENKIQQVDRIRDLHLAGIVDIRCIEAVQLARLIEIAEDLNAIGKVHSSPAVGISSNKGNILNLERDLRHTDSRAALSPIREHPDHLIPMNTGCGIILLAAAGGGG